MKGLDKALKELGIEGNEAFANNNDEALNVRKTFLLTKSQNKALKEFCFKKDIEMGALIRRLLKQELEKENFNF